MEFKTALFYLFSAIMVVASFRVITARNPVHAVLFLVLAFFNAGGLWILLNAEFLAIALVMVYVGAVMVLFLFVVMMLDIDVARLRQGFWSNMPVGAAVGILMVAEMAFMFSGEHFGLTNYPDKQLPGNISNTKELGRLMFTDYAYPFELASIILLLAIIAAVMLTLRHRPDSKRQLAAEQLATHPQGRLRIVAMKAEVEPKPAQESGKEGA